MRKAIMGAALMALAAIPAAANAQRSPWARAIEPGTGAVIAAPPGAGGGDIGGASIGSSGQHYRHYADRDRVCWHDRGYRHCRWR